MSINKKYKKRILFFLVVPVLIVAIIASSDFYIQLSAAVLLTLYVGFIIFLRDSLRSEEFDPIAERLKEAELQSRTNTGEQTSFDFGDDEGFEIVSKGGQKISDENLPFGESELTRETIEEFRKIVSDKFDKKDSNEFTSVLRLMLKALKDSLAATSALFFIYDPEKEKITLHAAESNLPRNNIIERKFEMENDVISRIAESKEPAILSNITPNVEADNIRYYSSPQNIGSFCGVPYDFNGQLVLILAVDSKGNNEFGSETVFVLGRFIRIISMLISLFEENHTRKVNDARLNALLSLISVEKPFDSIDEIASFFARVSENLIHWDFFTYAAFKASDKKFKILKSKTKNIPTKFVREGFEIDLKKSATGEAIRKGYHVYIPDLKEKKVARFNPDEKISTEGSFLAVPLVFDGQNYGVVTFESLKKNHYSKSDIAFIKKAVKIFTYYVYSFTNNAFLQNLVTLDPQTFALNEKEFSARLKNYLSIEKTCEKYGALILLKIDTNESEQSLFEDKFFPKTVQKIAALIKEDLKPNSLFGRLDKRLFAVYFFNTVLNDAGVWAEKMRKKIAQANYSDTGNQLHHTVSIGVSVTRNREIRKIFENAELALEKSVKAGGNKVTVGN